MQAGGVGVRGLSLTRLRICNRRADPCLSPLVQSRRECQRSKKGPDPLYLHSVIGTILGFFSPPSSKELEQDLDIQNILDI